MRIAAIVMVIIGSSPFHRFGGKWLTRTTAQYKTDQAITEVSESNKRQQGSDVGLHRAQSN
jgi:hypothetical protein